MQKKNKKQNLPLSLPHISIKINSKSIIDLNIKAKRKIQTEKTSRRQHSRKFLSSQIRQIFLRTQEV